MKKMKNKGEPPDVIHDGGSSEVYNVSSFDEIIFTKMTGKFSVYLNEYRKKGYNEFESVILTLVNVRDFSDKDCFRLYQLFRQTSYRVDCKEFIRQLNTRSLFKHALCSYVEKTKTAIITDIIKKYV